MNHLVPMGSCFFTGNGILGPKKVSLGACLAQGVGRGGIFQKRASLSSNLIKVFKDCIEGLDGGGRCQLPQASHSRYKDRSTVITLHYILHYRDWLHQHIKTFLMRHYQLWYVTLHYPLVTRMGHT